MFFGLGIIFGFFVLFFDLMVVFGLVVKFFNLGFVFGFVVFGFNLGFVFVLFLGFEIMFGLGLGGFKFGFGGEIVEIKLFNLSFENLLMCLK